MARGDLVISADFGTSGVKAGVVDGDLTILARSMAPYPLHLAPGGRAEQAPEDWWAALVQAVAALHEALPGLRERVGAVVFCSQICGVICADENGIPLRNCLTWMDKRGAVEGRRLVGGFPGIRGYRLDKGLLWLALANGAPAQNGMDPTAKMLWLRDHEPDVFDRTRWFLDVRDWLVHRACGEITTIPESANLTWVMNTRRGREGWSGTLARMAGVPLDKLPAIVQGDAPVGTLTTTSAQELGLGAQVEVIGGTSDVTAAALGTGEVEDGALHISMATSAWIAGFFDSRRVSIPHAYATITSGLAYRPLLIATQESAGSALDWAAQLLGKPVADAVADMGEIQPDDPFFLPWLAGERVPVDDHTLRGTFHGLGLAHDRVAMMRASAEGVALNLRWAFENVLKERGAQQTGPIALVGGAAANPVFAQLLADSLNRELRVGAARHAGVLGAATLAAPAMGWATSATEASRGLKGRAEAEYAPDPTRAALMDARAERLDKIRRDVIRSYRHD
ncbi:xylulokinase [Shimia abyssi]|uniref:Xylulokinase n=1 Tax=Shimia abyssi TaxID=1662395 RepID=A0A2P8FAP5_9RHOB|nr:FGGY family carbohydrate kinase [Shimia abyssi]PSL18732.1 xylulokinase [Shimia abyssi]